jgi:hypothetical protein
MILSPPRGVYGQTVVLRAALGVLALFGVIFSVAVSLGSNPSEVPGFQIGAAILVAYAVLCYLIGRTKLTLFPEGVQRSSVLGTKEMLWTDVAEYRYRIVSSGSGFAVGGLIGAAVKAAVEVSQGKPAGPPRLTLVGRDGSKLLVTPNVKDSEQVIQMIVAEIHNLLKPEIKRRLANNDEVAFGPLRLSFRGVSWKGKDPIPLDEIDRVLIAGRKLRIRRKGKPLGTLAVMPEKIPNVLLAMEMIEELRVNAGLSRVSATFA